MAPHLSSVVTIGTKGLRRVFPLFSVSCYGPDLTSSHDSYPAFFLSFSTVRLQLVFSLPLLLFPSGAESLQSLFWSCIIICPIMSHLLIYAVSPFYSEVSSPLFLAALQY